jgi:cyclophilin family peptidyl-prolyl cis-trans isomerase
LQVSFPNFFLPLYSMRFMTRKLIYFMLLAAFLSNCSKPIADFQIDVANLVIPSKIGLINQSSKAETFEWIIGDSIISRDRSPNYQFNNSGRHTIILRAKKGKKATETKKEVFLKPPNVCLALLSTSEGDILLKLYDNTLEHQNNFAKLVEDGFYKDILFHRVINGFMIQAGDPSSKGATSGQRLGSGDIGYTLPKEINKQNFHVKGALAAARLGDQSNPDKRSSGCQFYIVHGEGVTPAQLDNVEAGFDFKYPTTIREKYFKIGGAPQLDMNYTVFGEVIEGLEIIDRIATMKTDGNNRPTNDVKIKNLIILK